jgi:hypothetical protein
MTELELKQIYNKSVLEKYKGRIVQPFEDWKQSFLKTNSVQIAGKQHDNLNAKTTNVDHLESKSHLTINPDKAYTVDRDITGHVKAFENPEKAEITSPVRTGFIQDLYNLAKDPNLIHSHFTKVFVNDSKNKNAEERLNESKVYENYKKSMNVYKKASKIHNDASNTISVKFNPSEILNVNKIQEKINHENDLRILRKIQQQEPLQQQESLKFKNEPKSDISNITKNVESKVFEDYKKSMNIYKKAAEVHNDASNIISVRFNPSEILNVNKIQEKINHENDLSILRKIQQQEFKSADIHNDTKNYAKSDSKNVNLKSDVSLNPEKLPSRFPIQNDSQQQKRSIIVKPSSVKLLQNSHESKAIQSKMPNIYDNKENAFKNDFSKNKNKVNIKDVDSMFNEIVVQKKDSIKKSEMNENSNHNERIEQLIGTHMKTIKIPAPIVLKVRGYSGMDDVRSFHINPYEHNWKSRFLDNIAHATEMGFQHTISKNRDLSKEAEVFNKNYPKFKIGYTLFNKDTGKDFLASNPPYNEIWDLHRVAAPKENYINKKMDVIPDDLIDFIDIHNDSIKKNHKKMDSLKEHVLLGMKYHPGKEYWKEHFKYGVGLKFNDLRQNTSQIVKNPQILDRYVVMGGHPELPTNLVNMAKAFDVHEPESIHVNIANAVGKSQNVQQLRSKIDEIFDKKAELPDYAIGGLFSASAFARKVKNAFSFSKGSKFTAAIQALNLKLDEIQKMINSGKKEGEISNKFQKANDSLKEAKKHVAGDAANMNALQVAENRLKALETKFSEGSTTISSKLTESPGNELKINQITPSHFSHFSGHKDASVLPSLVPLSSVLQNPQITAKVKNAQPQLIQSEGIVKKPQVYSKILPELVPLNDVNIGFPINKIPNIANIGTKMDNDVADNSISCHMVPKNNTNQRKEMKKKRRNSSSSYSSSSSSSDSDEEDEKTSNLGDRVGAKVANQNESHEQIEPKAPYKVHTVHSEEELQSIIKKSGALTYYNYLNDQNIGQNMNTKILPDSSMFIGLHVTMAQKNPQFAESLASKHVGKIDNIEGFVKDPSLQVTPVNEIASINGKFIEYNDGTKKIIKNAIVDKNNNDLYFVIGN